ncbi:MAG TPA: AmmeMemoRadiSam system protein B [Bryobacteraceae bacterium]|nr:AmmeMemoRadiSam system protein B [Bryobacteraceae bacterium]
MSAPLARLRSDLDFMPSPVEDRPGLLIRDSFRYSDAVLIIPPPLVECLTCFDGAQTQLDLRRMLVDITGELQVGEIEEQIIDVLTRSGFLEDETFERLKEESHQAFRNAPVREPSHAGAAYPEDPSELRETVREWMGDGARPAAPDGNLIGIAAPHVSPSGGYESYRAAYRLLGPEYRDRTFVILGTSHYGVPEKFGLTRKPYRTPFGDARTDIGLVDELTRLAPEAIGTEDYCHAVEHSIEFQVVFLQSIFGPDIRILQFCAVPMRTASIAGGSRKTRTT